MSGPRIHDSSEGALLRVRVAPGAKREGIVGVFGDALKVAVRQPAEGGRANKAVCAVVAAALDCAPRCVVVHRGATSRDKVLRFTACNIETLRSKVAALLVLLGPS